MAFHTVPLQKKLIGQVDFSLHVFFLKLSDAAELCLISLLVLLDKLIRLLPVELAVDAPAPGHDSAKMETETEKKRDKRERR